MWTPKETPMHGSYGWENWMENNCSYMKSRMKGNSHVQFFWGVRSPTFINVRVPPLTFLGTKWSGGPTHPNQGYAGIREEQHLTMFMTNWILTYQ